MALYRGLSVEGLFSDSLADYIPSTPELRVDLATPAPAVSAPASWINRAFVTDLNAFIPSSNHSMATRRDSDTTSTSSSTSSLVSGVEGVSFATSAQ